MVEKYCGKIANLLKKKKKQGKRKTEGREAGEEGSDLTW
jgi:hypothetical protein